jgi:hypothetical protein
MWLKTNQISDQQDFIYLFMYFPRVTKCRLGLAHPCKALQATQKNASNKACSFIYISNLDNVFTSKT